jgi:DNA-binding CsgD family transcriptional regulator
VKNHTTHLLRKLNAVDRAQAKIAWLWLAHLGA